uniref:Uncharacterized protein n=1 Tax=Panagrolaimus sp. PS1159 TaxID=55785 RepID=A0AC35ES01_9BILA
MSFSDLKVSEDLSVCNSSKQNIISQEDLSEKKVWNSSKHSSIGIKYYLRIIGHFKTFIFGFFIPFMLLPLLFSGREEFKCIFVVLVMSIYWIVEIVPLPATAMFPIFLFPLTGIMSPKDVAKEYMNDTIFLFIGGLIVAAAVEKSALHERIALRVLTLSGSSPKMVMFAFMFVTALLSMFISNTATTAMMVPIAQSVIAQLEVSYYEHHKASSAALLESSMPQKNFHKSTSAMSKGMIISICFAANIGGTGTVTGTPPNLVLVGILSTLYPNAKTGVHYLSFFVFAFPLMLLCLMACWGILTFWFLRHAPEGNDTVTNMMHDRYAKLPQMSYAEKSVGIVFIVMLLMWLTRSPEIVPGFGDLFPKGMFTDATSSMIISALLFILPAEKPKFRFPTIEELEGKPIPKLRVQGEEEDDQGIVMIAKKQKIIPSRLMDWKTMLNMFPWSVVWLLGGGFALAAGVKVSGLSVMLGNILGELETLPLWSLQVICLLSVMAVTNICSNTVTASIFIPVVSTLASKMEIHPLTLMLPTTIACSFAFMLPVGTPPNAIVFSSGMLKVTDMIQAGFLVTIATLIITVGYMQTFAHLVFHFDEFPDWARLLPLNETMSG